MSRQASQRRRNQKSRRAMRIEALERRLCLAASLGWDGPGLGSAELSYYIGDVPASVGLQQAQVESAIKTALNAWSDIADITFTPTTQARQSDSLDITFRSLDGEGDILAQAFLPDDVNRGRLAGDIQFDAADPWEIGNGQGSAAFDLVYVAAHEIGHALGLDHVNLVGSVMRPNVSPNQVFSSLSSADGDALLELYASPAGDTSGTDTGVPSGTDTDEPTNSDEPDDGDNSSDGENRDEDERRRRRGRNRRGRFGGWQRRIGGATADVLVAAPSHHDVVRPSDVNGDDSVSALDALLILNELTSRGSGALGFARGRVGDTVWMVDVNGDDSLSAMDVLMVVNELNGTATTAQATADAAGEGATTDDGAAPPSEADVTNDEVLDDNPPPNDGGEEPGPADPPPHDNPDDTGSAEPPVSDNPDDNGGAEPPASDNPDDAPVEDDDTTEPGPDDGSDEEEDVPDDEAEEDEPVEDEEEEVEPDEDDEQEADEPEEDEADEDSDEDEVDDEEDADEAEDDDDEVEEENDHEDDDEDDAFDEEGCPGGGRGGYGERWRDRFADFENLLFDNELAEGLWERVGSMDFGDFAFLPDELDSIAFEHHRPHDPIARFDANEDGALTEDEVPERRWQRISLADADGNGIVTAAELEDARQHRSGRWRRDKD